MLELIKEKTVPEDVAKKAIDDAIYRIMLTHEMVAARNARMHRYTGLYTDGPVPHFVARDRAEQKARANQHIRKDIELCLPHKRANITIRQVENAMLRDFDTAFDYSKVAERRAGDKYPCEHNEYWSNLTAERQNGYLDALKLTRLSEQDVLQQYMFSDDFKRDNPRLHDLARSKLNEKLSNCVPVGTRMPSGGSFPPDAVRKLFDMQYPGARKQLARDSRNKESYFSDSSKVMGGVLTGVSMMNPSTFIMGKAFAALMKTDAMAPVRNEMLKSVKRVADVVGFTATVEKAKTNKTGRFALKTATVLGFGLLLSVGLVNAEEVPDMVGAVMENIDAQPAIDLTNNFDNPYLTEPGISKDDVSPPLLLDDMRPPESNNDVGVSTPDEDMGPPLPEEEFGIQASTYTVVSGDTLSEIAQARLELAGLPTDDYKLIHEHAKQIAALNDMESIHKLGLGELKLPEIDKVGADKLVNAAQNHGLDEVYAMPTPEVTAPPELGLDEMSAQYAMSAQELVDSMSIEYSNPLLEVERGLLVDALMAANDGKDAFVKGDVINVAAAREMLSGYEAKIAPPTAFNSSIESFEDTLVNEQELVASSNRPGP